MTSYQIEKNKSKTIIPIALEKYYTQGIPVEETIKNHRNIFDFCIAKKASRDYFYRSVNKKTGTQVDLNKLIRYYCSKNKGEKLYKIKKASSDKPGPEQSVCESKSDLQILFNKPFQVEKWEDYNIDYEFYISEAYKIIDKIEPENIPQRKAKQSGQMSLF